MSKIGIYPGTFDPITYGHIDIIKRSLKMVSKLIVAVSNDYSKDYLFSSEERVDIIKKSLFKDLNLSNTKIKVLNVQKINNLILHHTILESGEINVGDHVQMEIDALRRKKITINHSSTHLLNQALREVLGSHVEQKGSLVTDKYLRFDFSHNKPLSLDEIASIEKIISNEISACVATKQKITSYKKAIESGALAFFDEKYDDEVRVVNIGSKSIELCGGTHIADTSSIRLFKILNESAVSTGIRRIEAITGDEAYKSYQSLYRDVKELSVNLNINPNELIFDYNKIYKYLFYQN